MICQDKEEWSFECKRDDRAEKESLIRANWLAWASKRYIDGNDEYNDGIDKFAAQSAELEINKLK